MYGIIYKATGPTGKVYVGQTTYSLNHRKGAHKYRSLKGDKRTTFQTALLDEGFDNFTWEQIDTADTAEELDDKEKAWITFYNSMIPAKGYNNQDGGKKFVASEETRRKNGEAKKGKQTWMKGKHHTEETRRKISEALSGEKSAWWGRKHTEEQRKKMSRALSGEKNPLFGKHPSEETRRKMSEAHKRQVPWNKGKNLSLYIPSV
jgi:group I intron endonuclease